MSASKRSPVPQPIAILVAGLLILGLLLGNLHVHSHDDGSGTSSGAAAHAGGCHHHGHPTPVDGSAPRRSSAESDQPCAVCLLAAAPTTPCFDELPEIVLALSRGPAIQAPHATFHGAATLGQDPIRGPPSLS